MSLTPQDIARIANLARLELQPEESERMLTQINGFWCLPNSQWPIGWLQEKGILSECSDLLNATVALRATHAIYLNSGWNPWRTAK